MGSLFRTAEALGVKKLLLTGHTPYPKAVNDARIPHESNKLSRAIHKTALGAENSLDWQHAKDILRVMTDLKGQGFTVAALEQATISQPLPAYRPPAQIALIIGREVEGIEPEVLNEVDVIIEIPMLGQKESLNVVQAAAMALYHFRFN